MLLVHVCLLVFIFVFAAAEIFWKMFLLLFLLRAVA